MYRFGARYARAATRHVLRRDDKLAGVVCGGLCQHIATGALELVVLAIKCGIMAVSKRTADRRTVFTCTHPVSTATGTVIHN
jgi:hypothetical protein